MNIGIDLDDTITDVFEHKLSYAYKYDIENFGGNNLVNPLERWTSNMFNWTKDNDLKFFNDGYSDKMNNVSPRIFAKETINKLYQQGHNIYIITARSNITFKDAYLQTKDFLDRNEINYTEILENSQIKEDICKEYNIDVFIDDSEKHCYNVSRLGVKTFLFSTMRNLNFDISGSNINRVFCWIELYDKIIKDV